jgi:hypothetical protein
MEERCWVILVVSFSYETVEYERFHAPHILSFYFTLQLTSPASLDRNLAPFIHELSLPLR